MKTPLVSVIMSEYNTDIDLLKQSIQSTIDQTYKNLELIIIDDCGKNSPYLKEIVASFNDKRIKLYKNKNNNGLVYSLNKAIHLSKGEYIARIDTDDISYPARIEEQILFAVNHPEYNLVSARCDYYDGEKIWGESKNRGEVTREKLLNGCPIVHPSVMFKKSSIKDIGYYQNYRRCEDYATWIEMYVSGHKMYTMDKKLIRYHLSINDYKKKTLKDRMPFLNMLSKQYIKLKPNSSTIIKMYAKTILAGIVPGRALYSYHRKKLKAPKD